ncbi:MAG: Holliday junction resolvase RuvX [Clostridia bacterium]|nr:Holliday junction resolvase RuvX [Clostridia bacterium]
MVIMSIDYGDARTGIAVCDEFEMLASPVEVIHSDYEPKVIARIKEICAKYRPSLLVVGLPKNMNSSVGERAEKCMIFAENLKSETGIEVTMWDERLTTVSAHNFLNQTNTRGKKRKNVVDAVAATIILEDYLAYRKNKNV